MAVAMPMEGASGQGVLTMQDLVLINMIKNRPVHGRDIYFAGTVAVESRQFLEPYQQMEGIAFRITDTPVVDAVNGQRGWSLMEDYAFTGVEDPSVYKCDQAVQLLKNYVSAYHRLAYNFLDRGRPDSVQLVLDRAADLFVTLPDEWAEVLPSRAMIVGKLVDGLQGPAAAADTLQALADQALEAARRMGDQNLAGLAITLSNLASGTDGTLGYRQELEYRQLFDRLDDGSVPFAWMRVEVSLLFSDYIGAWRIADGMSSAEDSVSAALAQQAGVELRRTLENSPIGYRVNVRETGLSILFESIDADAVDEITLRDDLSTGWVLREMIRLASGGHRISAISAGLLLSSNMADRNQAGIVRDLALEMLVQSPETTLEWSRWFVTERNRVSPEALAFMAARGGRGAMVYAALEEGDVASADQLDSVLQDPAVYAENVPEPGRGSGAYEWVNSLTEGS
jgi:hypothetical protein